MRLVKAALTFVYDELDFNPELFEHEYHKLSQNDEDPIGQWLKGARARGETSESDPVLLNLLIELHRKIDGLEKIIKNEKPIRESLRFSGEIDAIGFENFTTNENVFEIGKMYYTRIEMLVHPKRDVPVIFEAIEPNLVKIVKMHEHDIKEWASYLTAQERILIRAKRNEKEIVK
jgi:hypothetical protein